MIENRHGGAVDHAVADVEQLLADFLIGALGLTLQSVMRGHRHGQALKSQDHRAPTDVTNPPVRATWETDQGVVSISGAYDLEQSRRVYAHVLFICWSLAPRTHHEGWWRCDIRRPRDWTKGRGGEPVIS